MDYNISRVLSRFHLLNFEIFELNFFCLGNFFHGFKDLTRNLTKIIDSHFRFFFSPTNLCDRLMTCVSIVNMVLNALHCER